RSLHKAPSHRQEAGRPLWQSLTLPRSAAILAPASSRWNTGAPAAAVPPGWRRSQAPVPGSLLALGEDFSGFCVEFFSFFGAPEFSDQLGVVSQAVGNIRVVRAQVGLFQFKRALKKWLALVVFANLEVDSGKCGEILRQFQHIYGRGGLEDGDGTSD